MLNVSHLKSRDIDLGAIRCLSVREPFASLALAGIRPVECRSWSTDYRGPLVIHSASSKASLSADVRNYLSLVMADLAGSGEMARSNELAEWMARTWPSGRQWRGEPLGAILGVVDLDECGNHVAAARWSYWDAWYPDEGYVWRVENPRPLPCPIPCSGKLSLWKPDAAALAEIAKIL